MLFVLWPGPSLSKSLLPWSGPRPPFQYALSTKSGRECVAHALQALTDLSDRVTVLSIDGIGAFDLISRGAMLEGIRSVLGGDSVLPFVLQFYDNSSSYLWETHEIRQGEGGEQGDPLLPMLYALGQHRALLAVQSQLFLNERLMGFSGRCVCVSEPERTCELHNILRQDLWDHSRIQVHAGKTQIWNRGGHVPTDHDVMLAAVRIEDPEAQIWFGDLQAPVELRGIRVFGTPLGTAEFVQAQLQATVESHEFLLSRIPLVPDLQSAFLLLFESNILFASLQSIILQQASLASVIRRCGSGSSTSLASCLTRPVDHSRTSQKHCGGHVRGYDEPTCHCGPFARGIAEQIHLGISGVRHPGLGAVSCRGCAHVNPNLTSWIPGFLLMVGSSSPPCVWSSLFAAHSVWPRLSPTEQALLRLQSGPMAGLPFPAVPTSSLSRLPSALPCLAPPPPLAFLAPCFSHLPVWPSTRRPSPPPCSVFEVSPLRALLRGCVVKRGARVSMNVFVTDLDLPVAQQDGRRLEVIADGLPLFGGPQLAIDTTLVTSVRANGLPRRRCAMKDGAALIQARRRKQRCYPELFRSQWERRV